MHKVITEIWKLSQSSGGGWTHITPLLDFCDPQVSSPWFPHLGLFLRLSLLQAPLPFSFSRTVFKAKRGAHTCNLSYSVRLRQKNDKLKPSLGNLAKLDLKINCKKGCGCSQVEVPCSLLRTAKQQQQQYNNTVCKSWCCRVWMGKPSMFHNLSVPRFPLV